MTLPLPVDETAPGNSRRRSFEPVMTFTGEGLVLGRTIIEPLRQTQDRAPQIAIDGAAERVLALLAVAYGNTAQPGVLGNIRRAARYWRGGQNHLAAIEIALTGLPLLRDEAQAAARLHTADMLLADGVAPYELIEDFGLDPDALDFTKYNQDQPRVPAGNPDGGQWTSNGDETPGIATGGGARPSIPRGVRLPSATGEGAGSSTRPGGKPSTDAGGSTGSSIRPGGKPASDAGGSSPHYQLVKEPPKDAKIVIPSDGVPIGGGNPPISLIAPPHADYRQVYAAGQAIAHLPFWEQSPPPHAAIAQGGQFDFQRDTTALKIYKAYIPAANYAVGVYMAGAGYTLAETLVFAKAYAFGYSSNDSAQDREEWIQRGWNDAAAGRWK
jgi:hypothetical protein